MSRHWAAAPIGSADLGGKAASLDRLARSGYRIPPGFCLTAAAFREQLAAVADPGGLAAAIAALPHENARCAIVRRSRRRRRRTTSARRSPAPSTVSVRSSRASRRVPRARARRHGPPADLRRPLVGARRGRRHRVVRRAPRDRAGSGNGRGRSRHPPLLAVAVEPGRGQLSHATRAAVRGPRDGGRRPGADPGRGVGRRVHPSPGHRPRRRPDQRDPRARRAARVGRGHARRRSSSSGPAGRSSSADAGDTGCASSFATAAGRDRRSVQATRPERRGRLPSWPAWPSTSKREPAGPSTSRRPAPASAGSSSRPARSRPMDAMTDPATSPRPRSVPIDWREPSDRELTWEWDDMHTPRALRPSARITSAAGPMDLPVGYRRLGVPVAVLTRVWNGYAYFAFRIDAPGGRARRCSPGTRRPPQGWIPLTAAYWRDEALPELRAMYREIDEIAATTCRPEAGARPGSGRGQLVERASGDPLLVIAGPYQVLDDLADRLRGGRRERVPRREAWGSSPGSPGAPLARRAWSAYRRRGRRARDSSARLRTGTTGDDRGDRGRSTDRTPSWSELSTRSWPVHGHSARPAEDLDEPSWRRTPRPLLADWRSGKRRRRTTARAGGRAPGGPGRRLRGDREPVRGVSRTSRPGPGRVRARPGRRPRGRAAHRGPQLLDRSDVRRSDAAARLPDRAPSRPRRARSKTRTTSVREAQRGRDRSSGSLDARRARGGAPRGACPRARR